MTLIDLGASTCGKDAAGKPKFAAEVDSVGSFDGNVLNTKATSLKCLSTPPVTRTLNIVITYAYQPSSDTLLDDGGTVWMRP